MIQQILALVVIMVILSRMIRQKIKGQISNSEFYLWSIFWLISALAIIFIKTIDQLVSRIGFSGSGIDVLLYAGIAWLFYQQFRARLRFEKMERDITKIVTHIALKDK